MRCVRSIVVAQRRQRVEGDVATLMGIALIVIGHWAAAQGSGGMAADVAGDRDRTRPVHHRPVPLGGQRDVEEERLRRISEVIAGDRPGRPASRYFGAERVWSTPATRSLRYGMRRRPVIGCRPSRRRSRCSAVTSPVRPSRSARRPRARGGAVSGDVVIPEIGVNLEEVVGDGAEAALELGLADGHLSRSGRVLYVV